MHLLLQADDILTHILFCLVVFSLLSKFILFSIYQKVYINKKVNFLNTIVFSINFNNLSYKIINFHFNIVLSNKLYPIFIKS